MIGFAGCRLRPLCAALIVAAAGIVHAQAPAPGAPSWPDTPAARLQALALIQTLNAEILASTSATATLERWCRAHQLADAPSIVATLMQGITRPASPQQRKDLQVTDAEPVNYRRVQLRCGTRVLSEADNWYVPARLTSEMNRQLETTDTPFGRVVQPLQPYRRTMLARMLWSPLPDGWETNAPLPPPTARSLPIPDALFEHRAILYTRDHTPFAEVDEVYHKNLLAFRPATLPQ
jgi:chorismate-pyruvate lyase